MLFSFLWPEEKMIFCFFLLKLATKNQSIFTSARTSCTTSDWPVRTVQEKSGSLLYRHTHVVFSWFFKLSSHVVFLCFFFQTILTCGCPAQKDHCTVHSDSWKISFAILNFEKVCFLTWRTSTWRCPFFFESCQQLRKRTFEKSEKEKFLGFARFVERWLTLLRSPPPSWSAPGTLVPSSGLAASGSWCCCWTSQSQTSTVQRPHIKPKGKIVNM